MTTAPRPVPPGRPSQLTPELQAKIVTVVRAGNYLKTAAQYNGVGESTLRLWLQKGRAAAEARDQHDPDHLYCPGCDADRTAAVDAVEQDNYRELARYEAEKAAGGKPEPRATAVLGRCPSCFSELLPEQWTVPEQEARYLEFLEVITVAQTAAEVAAVTHWRAAFADDWRAARDFLRSTNPGAWASTTRVAISQEEADRRIDAAAEQVLIAVGIDTDNLDEGHLAPGELPIIVDGEEDEDGNQHID